MCDLKSKFKEWEDWLLGEDIHSIRNQIHSMIWNSAVFLCVNEARKHASLNEKGEPELNPMVHGFINFSFFQTQLLAIRRLVDTETRTGSRSVFSLYRLIDDMENNCELLTRKNVLETQDFPYDYKGEELRLNRIRLNGKANSSIGQSLIKCAHSKHIHKSFDAMASNVPENRNPQDTIPTKVFEWLKHKLSSCQKICDYVNKHLAHSATPESRSSINADDIEITLGKVLDTHKIICEIAEFVGINLLYQSFGNFLSVPQFDQFKYFEKPLAVGKTVTKLHKFWNDYDRKTREWTKWDWQKEFNDFANA